MPLSDFDFSRCPIFHGMSPVERTQVLDLVENDTYPEGEYILREGRSTQFLWVVLRGKCRVVKSLGNGSERTLAELEPGAVFGEMSFFRPAPHSASVQAVTQVEVVRLSRAEFDELEQSGSKAAYKIVLNTCMVLADRMRRMDEWTGQIVDNSSEADRQEEWQEFRAKLYSDWNF